MNTPKVGKIYIFVRKHGDGFEHTEFVRDVDSAGFAADGSYHVHENHPGAWRDALAALVGLGFLELSEAKASGLVPASWEPSRETFVLRHGQAAIAREA